MRTSIILSLLSAAAFYTEPARADSVHGAVSGTPLGNPLPTQSVLFSGPDVWESSTRIRAFYESGCFPLPRDVEVNVDADGRYGNSNLWPGAQPLPATHPVIPADTLVRCIFVHFDPQGSSSTNLRGGFTLDPSFVRGIIIGDGLLDASDDVCGARSIYYPTGEQYRGLESPSQDTFELVNGRTVNFDLTASYPGDQMRVLTTCECAAGSC